MLLCDDSVLNYFSTGRSGTPDTQFDHCISALFAIMTQTVLGLILNGVLVGTVYTKIARSKQRSVRIVFSDKACIRQIRNRYYFMFQTFDRSSSVSHNQLIEAHVRCYAIKHETTGDGGEPIFFQQCVMRLSNPNDELGAPLMCVARALSSYRSNDKYSWPAQDGIANASDSSHRPVVAVVPTTSRQAGSRRAV